MKKIYYLLLIFALLLSAFLVSCGKSDNPDKTEKIEYIAIPEWQNYTIIYPNKARVFVDYENGDFTITAEAMAKISAEISYFMPLSTENIGVTYEKGE